MNAKAKGTRAERPARALLEREGWAVVRAGASLRAIQMKVNRRPSRKERAALAAFDNLPSGAARELGLFRDRQREPKIEVL